MPSDSGNAISYSPVYAGYATPMGSATGLTKWRGRIFVLCSTVTGIGVAILNEKDLTPVFYQDLPQVKDGHSILVSENGLYVVSTGTDEVLCFDLSDHDITNAHVVWQASTAHADTHHINSIVEVDGELHISAFGPKTSQMWSSALNGYIHNISRDTRVKEGIYHPHSLSERHGQLYYCESHRGSFCNLESSLFLLDGYSRGVSWFSDEQICLATSVGRKISKSSGVVGNPADLGEKTGQCSLTVRNIFSGEIFTQVDLSWFGPEIYDLLVIEPQSDFLTLAVSAYLAERQAIQILRSTFNEQNELRLSQISQRDAEIKQRDTEIAKREALIRAMENQSFYKLNKKYTEALERSLPPGTQRRRLYNMMINMLYYAFWKGPKILLQKIRDVFPS